MTSYDFGDLLLVPFPFTDQSTTKKRPAVVVSSLSYNRERPDVIIMAVTSQRAAASSGPTAEIRDWREAGLLKPSAVKPLVATLHRELALRRLGRLTPSDADRLKGLLRTIIG